MVAFEQVPILVGRSFIEVEAMDVVRSASQGAHYHVDATFVFPKLGIKKGAWVLWFSGLGPHELGFRLTLYSKYVTPVGHAGLVWDEISSL